MRYEKMEYKKIMAALVVTGMLLATGCAGNGTIPTEKIAGAERAVSAARDSSAATPEAIPTLKKAEDLLAEAKDAMNKKEYGNARRLAESATVNAELAQAQASTAKSKKAADEMRASVKALQRELDQMQTQ